MSVLNQIRGPFAVGLLRLVLSMVVLSGLWGCGRQDPVEALRDIGAEIKQDDDNNVTGVNLPTDGSDADLENLKDFSTLRNLDLSSSQITDDGLKWLTGLKELESLDLRNTDVTDAGMQHVAKLTGLKRLSIGDTAVTDAGLEHLKSLSHLEELSLVGKERPIEPKRNGWTDAIRLGIDLAGGTNLVFEIDREKTQKEINSKVMDQMVAAVGRRINPSGTEEVTVRKVGSDRIEVIIPGADRTRVEEIKSRITKLGSLEFVILANEVDHGENGIARGGRGLIAKARNVKRDYIEGGRVVAGWRPVGRDKDGVLKHVDTTRGQVVTRNNGTEFLVVFEEAKRRVTGEYLDRVFESADQSGGPAVSFVFTTLGGNKFFNLTRKYQPRRSDNFMRRLAVLLDDEIHSAPDLREPISTQGQISGRFTREEIAELISVLNAGALEVPIKKQPISEFSISPLLGSDVQEKGKRAIVIAAVAVFLFMGGYYWFAGLIADLCLVLNLILVLGVMALIDATFTLPGLAGLVLTIGMAVDANVLIFERIREESQRGSSMRMAIQNGFGRALTTIVDANVTTLITGVVLYMIGTDQVRGFAVTLIIGILMSMFTALYFGRLVFDIFERKRWLRKLKMMRIVGATRVDFVGKKGIAAVFSLALIMVGMGALFTRGEDNLDIDFSGGSMVTFEFVKPQEVADVRRKLQEKRKEVLGNTLTLEELTTLAELEQGLAGAKKRFRLRTKEQEIAKVRQAINEALREADEDLKREGKQPQYELRHVNLVYDADGISRIEEQPVASGTDKKTDGEKEDDQKANTSEIADIEFAGGHRVALTFYDQAEPTATTAGDQQKPVMTVTTVLDHLAEELKKTNKYEQPSALFSVPEDTLVSGIDSERGERFTTMELKARKELPLEDLKDALAGMKQTLDADPVFEEVNSFASSVASEMQESAIMAMLASLVAIVAYIWFRFQRITFGLAAVAALVHDVLIVLGMVALASYAYGGWERFAVLGLQDFKINLPMIAAFLTIVGYSLNDTIVVFDRIREVRGKNPALTSEMVNRSLNQTLSRTLLTSLTTLVVVLILYAIGGEGIHGFAFCLVMGVIVGTYSSIYVASPVLLWLTNRPGSATGRSRSAGANAA